MLTTRGLASSSEILSSEFETRRSLGWSRILLRRRRPEFPGGRDGRGTGGCLNLGGEALWA